MSDNSDDLGPMEGRQVLIVDNRFYDFFKNQGIEITMQTPLPPLTADMKAHSEALQDKIAVEIKENNGAISFARFMELALYTPGFGYYSAGSHKLGEGGDFITAPEISPLFAQCVGKQFAEILQNIPQAAILELGGGSGIFAQEALHALEKISCLPTNYYILETSADLRERQQIRLQKNCSSFFSRIIWLDRLPETFSGIIFANEILDALPVHCFRIEEQTVKERCVTFTNHQFDWVVTTPPPDSPLIHQVEPLQKALALADGYESEINLTLSAWIKSLADLLTTGIILFFDYGYGQREYYHPLRNTGTLRCYFQHRCHHNPFTLVGLQDLTADVDFTAVAASAHAAKLQVAGYTPQSAFLSACGIKQLLAQPAHSLEYYRQNQALKLLMLPSEMGSLVKVMALSKNWERPLCGFSHFDQRHTL